MEIWARTDPRISRLLTSTVWPRREFVARRPTLQILPAVRVVAACSWVNTGRGLANMACREACRSRRTVRLWPSFWVRKDMSRDTLENGISGAGPRGRCRPASGRRRGPLPRSSIPAQSCCACPPACEERCRERTGSQNTIASTRMAGRSG